MKANAARFIASCELVNRRNALSEDELQKRYREVEEQFVELTTARQKEWQALRWERLPQLHAARRRDGREGGRALRGRT